jgi:three-Cys-motif partner protein
VSQGQSGYTKFKHARFSPVLAQSLRISKAASIERFPYYHVDLNAGGGFNHDVHVKGSPLNFLDAVERTNRLNFYAFFVDNNPACIAELAQRPELAKYSTRVSVHGGDNAEILPVVSQFIAARERNPHHAVGSIVIDPNGYHKGVPWTALHDFCADHPKFDVFVNLNVRSFSLERPHILEGGKKGWAAHVLHPLSTFRTWFSRPHWMWTDVTTIGGNHWIQGVGRTLATHSEGYRSLGFYDSRSDEARAIIDGIEGTAVATAGSQSGLLWDLP